MKKTTLLCAVLCLFNLTASRAQGGFIQLGTALVADQGYRIIATSDGGYLTAGSAGAKAVLYKTDCLGTLVASIEKSYSPGPAVFWDVTELPDGSIVAVGGGSIAGSSDTGQNVILLRTNPLLVETASANFNILGKVAVGKSLAKTSSGKLLLWGEVTGFSVDFTDAFFQQVDQNTLQPIANPVIINNGVDLAARIFPTADGNFVLTGSSFLGNIFNPDAPIDNSLRAYKVDETGNLIWQAAVRDTFLAKYGVATSCGGVQSSQSGNILLGGSMYNGTDALGQDMFFALIDNNGQVLDTAYAFAAGGQKSFAISENHAAPGVYAMIGEDGSSPLGIPTFALAQVYEFANQLYTGPALLDATNPVSLRDLAEIDAGRFGILGTVPDNPASLTSTDIFIITPEASVGVVFQNCALAVTLSIPATAYQWLYEGQPIPGANQGVYFPDQAGLYQVQVIDDKGCFGVSDTFRVSGPIADFTFSSTGLSTSFTNQSVGGTGFAWTFGDGASSTQPNPSHAYANPGVYNVTLIVNNNCGFKDTVQYTIGVTPTSEVSVLDQLKISPNPTKGALFLDLNGESQESVDIMIINAVGQVVSSETAAFLQGELHTKMDLSNYPPGVYSLQVRSGKSSKSARIIKE